jgi:hypothetical protein
MGPERKQKRRGRHLLLHLLSWSLVVASFPLRVGGTGGTSSRHGTSQVTRPPLSELVERGYLEIFELARSARYSSAEIEAWRKQLAQQESAEKKRLEEVQKRYVERVKVARKELEALNRRASRDGESEVEERKRLHCRILRLEGRVKEAEIARKQGVPIAFDNRRAKLMLLEKWPAEIARIEQSIAAGTARTRRFGDVEDIGVRSIAEGQEKDLEAGQEAIREMKAYGLIPPEWEGESLTRYLRDLGDQLAVHSDLKIPLRLTILESEEVNAFALPGGYLFINTGLIAKAGTESEVVGVLAHELAHVTARHSAKLMKRVTIANLIFQAAQVTAMILTGGLVGIGTYYALQYGFFGLGLVLSLTLLGVSREFEDEADQLGVQYAWKAGYDPQGFITLFDKLAMEQGYVSTVSFFRTHPPFGERILSTFRELSYLPTQNGLQVDSLRFREVKREMMEILEQRRKDPVTRPTLKRFPDCPEEPDEEAGEIEIRRPTTGF